MDLPLETTHEHAGAEVAAQTHGHIQARVRSIRYEAERVLGIELIPLDGGSFPGFSPGAHIDLHLPNGVSRSYSLLNSPAESHHYLLGVLAEASSRGGSRYIHEQLRCGAIVPISSPRNNFKLDPQAKASVLIAGGIGITPILCMYRQLRDQGQPVQLLYCARERSQAAYLDKIEALGGTVHLHFDAEHEGRPCDLKGFLATQPPDVHAYCCGPVPMLAAFEAACEAVGIGHVHIERFVASEPVVNVQQSGYTVELAKSGRQLNVPAGASLLDVLLEAGVDVDYSCREGLCGACQTRVLGGSPDHRDSILTESEKASNTMMMICVSGAKSATLVLDLA